MVDSVLSYGSEVWGIQLAAKAAAGNGNTGCAAEKLHLSFLRNLLGVRQGTPSGVVLAETGERALWARWLVRTARLWNKGLAAGQQSLFRQAVAASAAMACTPGARQPSRQPWAQQVAAGMAAIGVQLDLAHPRPICIAAVRSGCQQRQLQLLQTAAARDGASKLQHYVRDVCGGKLEPTSIGASATYLGVIRERGRREALAQWRTGSHWGAEETGRWQRTPRDQRLCPHCGGGTETVAHMIFHCPLYSSLRTRFTDLFDPTPTDLHTFLLQPAPRLACFAAACRQTWDVASVALTQPVPPLTSQQPHPMHPSPPTLAHQSIPVPTAQ